MSNYYYYKKLAALSQNNTANIAELARRRMQDGDVRHDQIIVLQNAAKLSAELARHWAAKAALYAAYRREIEEGK
jgi:hypothetical protein